VLGPRWGGGSLRHRVEEIYLSEAKQSEKTGQIAHCDRVTLIESLQLWALTRQAVRGGWYTEARFMNAARRREWRKTADGHRRTDSPS